MDIYVCCQSIADSDQEFVAACFDNEHAAYSFCEAARTDLGYDRYFYVATLHSTYDSNDDDNLIP